MKSEVVSMTSLLTKHPGCSPDLVESLEKLFGHRLPDDYREYILSSNGGVGPVGKSGFLRLLCVPDEVIYCNEGYDVSSRLPGLLMFADDGGQRAFFFDSRSVPTKYVEVYWPIDIDEVEIIGETFVDFLRHVSNE